LGEAGYDPEVVKSYGLGILPDVFNRTKGRREVKELTGSNMVPVLVTDDGTVVSDSKNIVEWAKAHPAGAAAGAGATA
jgi:glutathione S-transferase